MTTARRTDIRWYTLFLCIFLFHQVLQALNIHWRLADNYLDPLLAVPVMLGTSVIVLRFWKPKEKMHTPTIVLFTLAISVFFEGPWFPHPKLYKDWLDIPLYILGALIFIKTVNRVPTPVQ